MHAIPSTNPPLRYVGRAIDISGQGFNAYIRLINWKPPHTFKFDVGIAETWLLNFNQPERVKESLFSHLSDEKLQHEYPRRLESVAPTGLPIELCLLIISKDPLTWLGVNKTWQLVVNTFMAHKTAELKSFFTKPLITRHTKGPVTSAKSKVADVMATLAVTKNNVLLRNVMKEYFSQIRQCTENFSSLTLVDYVENIIRTRCDYQHNSGGYSDTYSYYSLDGQWTDDIKKVSYIHPFFQVPQLIPLLGICSPETTGDYLSRVLGVPRPSQEKYGSDALELLFDHSFVKLLDTERYLLYHQYFQKVTDEAALHAFVTQYIVPLYRLELAQL
jgi:hypothetical protein